MHDVIFWAHLYLRLSVSLVRAQLNSNLSNWNFLRICSTSLFLCASHGTRLSPIPRSFAWRLNWKNFCLYIWLYWSPLDQLYLDSAAFPILHRHQPPLLQKARAHWIVAITRHELTARPNAPSFLEPPSISSLVLQRGHCRGIFSVTCVSTGSFRHGYLWCITYVYQQTSSTTLNFQFLFYSNIPNVF